MTSLTVLLALGSDELRLLGLNLGSMTNTNDPEYHEPPNDFSKEALSHFPVFPLIHAIRKDVELNIGEE